MKTLCIFAILGNLVSLSVTVSYWLSLGVRSWERATEPRPSYSCYSTCFEDSDHDSELHTSRGSHCPEQFYMSLMWLMWYVWCLMQGIRREINALYAFWSHSICFKDCRKESVSFCRVCRGVSSGDTALLLMMIPTSLRIGKSWNLQSVGFQTYKLRATGVSYIVRTCPTL